MKRLTELRSPRSKPISQYTKDLAHINSLCLPVKQKTFIIEGLLEEIKYKILCLKTPKLKQQVINGLQEELLWRQIERMQKSIIQKRILKQNMEISICEQCQQNNNIQQIGQVKKQIRDSLDSQIKRLLKISSKKLQMSDRQTMTSLGDVFTQSNHNSHCNTTSIQSQKSNDC